MLLLSYLGKGANIMLSCLNITTCRNDTLFDDEHKEKCVSFSLTFSKCQVPIRGEPADGRIWICFFSLYDFVVISFGLVWNSLEQWFSEGHSPSKGKSS